MFARAIAFIFLFQIPLATFAEPPTIGTMSAEVRGPDKRIDIDRTIDALVKLNVNTYYYLIWQNARDWDDLPAFCDAAAKHNIEVWPYVVPWSESPPKKVNGWGYSEPFKNDYIAWADAFGKLSREHSNVPGYVIDDFYDNTEEGHFTPNYVKKMVAAGQRYNPKLKFYPLMYYQTPWVEFTNRFGSLVDGCVLCYPKSEAGIRNAATYLADRRHGPSGIIELGRHKGAARGDGGSIISDVEITDPDNAEVSFYYDVTDQIEGDTSLQNARVRLNGRTVWESPTEGRMRDAIINVDLSRFVRKRERLHLQFDVVTVRTGVPEQLPVIIRFDDIRVYGAGRGDAPFATDLVLRGKELGKFDVIIMPGSRETGRFKIPFTLMPAGEAEQFVKRYDMRPTPQAVGNKVGLCLAMVKEGIAEGVVPYRTPLYPGDPFFDAIRQQFAAFQSASSSSKN